MKRELNMTTSNQTCDCFEIIFVKIYRRNNIFGKCGILPACRLATTLVIVCDSFNMLLVHNSLATRLLLCVTMPYPVSKPRLRSTVNINSRGASSATILASDSG